jgi:hypothetical protein
VGGRDSVAGVVGAAVILVVLFVIGPIVIFFGGAIWSALFGQLESDTNDPASSAAEGGNA